ncbi:uncharacterized protein [Palaemon carinicauda]|uniref:uncharacterized protein n=1 Tax=Palaemon carinicauda TaxID=392227 RepID=UPI0035B62E1B
MGPFHVRKNNETQKVWLLCITCTWSRAVNLKICKDLGVKEFLQSFQLHCFDYGIPELCVSDMGTQLVAGANVMQNLLSDHASQLYFEENNIRPIQFQQYFKGCSKLGSLVEVCVKQVKRLLFGSIKNLVLSYDDFEFIVCHTVHLVNRRPIAFKESLREEDLDFVPEPITPEQLVKGYELTSMNLLPELQGIPDEDPDWQPCVNPQQVKDEYMKLRKVRNNLLSKYHNEFLGTLIDQAVDKKDRYRPITQRGIKIGDIVLLKEVHAKPNNYPMGLVKELQYNSIGEVTGASIQKGSTREVVKRHITTLVPFLERSDDSELSSTNDSVKLLSEPPHVKRKAAIVSEQKTREILTECYVSVLFIFLDAIFSTKKSCIAGGGLKEIKF